MSMAIWTGRKGSGVPRDVRAGRRGFSLVEMLVVIGIIGILVSLAVVVGTKVIAAGKARATADIMRVLDESRDAWTRNWQKSLPEYLVVEETPSKQYSYPLIDARVVGAGGGNEDWTRPAWPALTYYTALVMQDPSIAPIFEQIDSAFVRPATAPLADSKGESEPWAARALEIVDAWDRPIRFVHPAYHGGYGDFWDAEAERMNTQRDTITITVPTNKGQGLRMEFRRSYRPFDADAPQRKSTWIGDADEGMCLGNTAYFYAPGEDGDPGTRADNVYTTVPRFPVETRDFD